eukprot:CAMPEP_0180808998 /NCGR_PEP_ID=MMETSP1038_2-20121128/64095_1 /TAXON_ID=632150 /ORGANISM="Azadinium spinosum, Strain 3D9" /LENGTH=33 /DNA_ID= /DNA_START= /DNA_END= /DNA_ORIENTATION=
MSQRASFFRSARTSPEQQEEALAALKQEKEEAL